MSGMVVTTPEVAKVVDDYEIAFASGAVFPITIDSKAGDSYQRDASEIRIVLAAKPGLIDPTKVLMAEDITIFLHQVASIQHRERIVVELTPEQKLEQTKLFQLMSETVQ